MRLRLLVFAAVATYTSGFLLWYSATALGLAHSGEGLATAVILEGATEALRAAPPHTR